MSLIRLYDTNFNEFLSQFWKKNGLDASQYEKNEKKFKEFFDNAGFGGISKAISFMATANRVRSANSRYDLGFYVSLAFKKRGTNVVKTANKWIWNLGFYKRYWMRNQREFGASYFPDPKIPDKNIWFQSPFFNLKVSPRLALRNIPKTELRTKYLYTSSTWGLRFPDRKEAFVSVQKLPEKYEPYQIIVSDLKDLGISAGYTKAFESIFGIKQSQKPKELTSLQLTRFYQNMEDISILESANGKFYYVQIPDKIDEVKIIYPINEQPIIIEQKNKLEKVLRNAKNKDNSDDSASSENRDKKEVIGKTKDNEKIYNGRRSSRVSGFENQLREKYGWIKESNFVGWIPAKDNPGKFEKLYKSSKGVYFAKVYGGNGFLEIVDFDENVKIEKEEEKGKSLLKKFNRKGLICEKYYSWDRHKNLKFVGEMNYDGDNNAKVAIDPEGNRYVVYGPPLEVVREQRTEFIICKLEKNQKATQEIELPCCLFEKSDGVFTFFYKGKTYDARQNVKTGEYLANIDGTWYIIKDCVPQIPGKPKDEADPCIENLEKARQENQRLQREIEKIREKLRSSDADNEELEDLRRQLDELREKNKNLAEKIIQDDKNNNVAELLDALEKLEAQNEALKSELEASKDLLDERSGEEYERRDKYKDAIVGCQEIEHYCCDEDEEFFY